MTDKDLTLWLRLRDDASKQLRSLLPSLKQVGLAVGVAAAAGVALSISSFTDFQTALNNVKAVSQATAAEMALFETQALQMGASTKFSAQEAAEAQAFLAMAGLSVQEALAALPGTLQLAAAGQLDLAAAADLTTNVMSGYRMAVSDIPRINDVLATTAAAANTTVGQMGDAMSFVAPVAAAAGIAFEETSAALGRLASNAFQGERGGTALRGILIKLMTPTASLENLTDKYSLSLKNVDGSLRPLNAILGEFNTKGVKSEEVLAHFGARAGPGMLALLAEGASSLRGYTENLDDVTGAAERMATVQQEGIVGAMTNMSSAASTLSIIIGKELEPAFTVFATSATEGMRWLGENIGEVVRAAKAIATGIAASFTAAGVAYLALNAQMVATTIATNAAKVAMIAFNLVTRANPIGLLVTAIGAVVAAYVYWQDTIHGFLKGAWNKYISAIESGIEFMRPLADMIGIDLPESMGTLKFELDDSSVATETFTEAIAAVEEPVVAVTVVVDDAKEAVLAFAGTIDAQSTAIDHWGSQLEGVGTAVEPIPPFIWALNDAIETMQNRSFNLGTSIDAQSTAIDHWGSQLEGVGTAVEPIPLLLDETEQSANQLDVTLAALAGQMGGAAGQAANLAIGMMQSNDQLEEGEEGFSNIQIGAAVAGYALQSIGEEMGGTVGAIVSGVGTMASAFATGGPLGAAIAGAGLLIKGLISLGGPSEAELAAREAFGAWHKGAVDALGETKRFADEVQRAIADGWDRTLAEARAGFILWGQAAGKTYDEAFADYARYEQAQRDGNTALMARLEAEYAGYRELARVMDEVYDSVISAYARAKDAGVAAYDEVYLAAIEAGKGQAEAASLAAEAQVEATAAVLAAEGEKYARIAAFEAALEAIRSGNAHEAAEAARTAARETREAWGVAMDAVEQASNHASDAMVDDARRAGNAMSNAARQAEDAAQRARDQIPTYFHGGGYMPGRQHGGPVSAGQPYVVGEGGRAEIFVPGQSGRVVPNSGIPSAAEIGAAVAVAMRRAPLVVPRDAVTDTVLGNSPSRQALAGYV